MSIKNLITVSCIPNVSEDVSGDQDSGGYSETKNVAGAELEKGRPVGRIGLIITVPLSLYLIVFGLIELNFVMIILAWFPVIGIGISYMYSVSEKQWMESWIMNLSEDLDRKGKRNTSESDTESVCRECHEPISPDVKRCPHCGWKPKKRGNLWWGATAVMSFNPIGWALGAKGASDNYKAAKGVSKEVNIDEAKELEEPEVDVEVSSEVEPTDALENLNELKNQGIITEAEFEEKKKELLERI